MPILVTRNAPLYSFFAIFGRNQGLQHTTAKFEQLIRQGGPATAERCGAVFLLMSLLWRLAMVIDAALLKSSAKIPRSVFIWHGLSQDLHRFSFLREGGVNSSSVKPQDREGYSRNRMFFSTSSGRWKPMLHSRPKLKTISYNFCFPNRAILQSGTVDIYFQRRGTTAPYFSYFIPSFGCSIVYYGA